MNNSRSAPSHAAVQQRPPDRPAVHPTVPKDLAAAITAGGVILLLSRTGGSPGVAGRRLAAAQAYATADLLATAGIEVGHLLPPAEALEAQLRQQATGPVGGRDTTGVRSRPCTVVPLSRQVLLAIQHNWSARRPQNARRHRADQPIAAQQIAKVVADRSPVLIADARGDTAWDGQDWGPVLRALRRQSGRCGDPAYYLDRRRPWLVPLDADLEEYLFTRAARVRQEAASLARARAQRQRDWNRLDRPRRPDRHGGGGA